MTPVAATECPDLLRALPAWICWKFEQVPGEPKPRKVPYYSGGSKRRGIQGRPEDRQQMVSFDAALAAAERRGMDGVGFCPLPEFGITVVDFDNCVAAGTVHPEVEQAVAGTYAELSPSGHGAHAFYQGDLGNRKDAHGEPFGVETFSSRGYVTFTGASLEITDLTDSTNTIAPVTPEIKSLCAARFGSAEVSEAGTGSAEPLGLTQEQLHAALEVLDASMGHDGWLKVGMALHHETRGEGFDLWDEWSADGVQYPGRDVLAMRWDSFGRGNQRPTTVHALVKMANEHGAHIDLAATAASDFDVIATPEALRQDIKPNRFQVAQAGAFAGGKPPGWMIKGILPAADLVVLFGESTSGKSFMSLDLAGAVARGEPWRGHRTKRGRVVIVAAEGGAGYRNRLKAYAAKHNINLDDLDIGIVHATPNLLLKDDALDLCKAIIAFGPVALVIVDTLSQTMPGANENAAEDVGKALAHCRGIRVATGAVVMLVHHAGKDASKGARGWSGLKAAADAEIEVLRMPTGRMLRVSKQKDGEDGLAFGFDLDVVPVGVDEDGDIVTSCVIRETELPAVQQVELKKLGKWETLVAGVINDIAKEQTAGIELSAVIDEGVRRTPRPEGRDTRKQYVKRALDALVALPDSPYFVEDGCLSLG